MKALPLLLCAVVGGVAGALLIRVIDPKDETATVREANRGSDVAELRAEIEKLRQEIRDRADEIPGSHAGPPPAAEGTGSTARPPPSNTGTSARPPRSAVSKEALDWIRGYRSKPFGHSDSNRLFGWLTQNKEKIPAVINAIKAEIEENPNNADLRVALATAWVAHLTNNTTPGPQQGIVWGEASAAYDKALELNPRHWQARFGKSFGMSMMPEFLGQRPKAIKQFEELMEMQEQGAPEAHHAETYFRLGTLYKDAGNAAKAREIWDRGLRLFPDNGVLKGTIEASTKK